MDKVARITLSIHRIEDGHLVDLLFRYREEFEEIEGLTSVGIAYEDGAHLEPCALSCSSAHRELSSKRKQRIEELEKERDELSATLQAVALAANCPKEITLVSHVANLWVETSLADEEIQRPCTTEDRAILNEQAIEALEKKIEEHESTNARWAEQVEAALKKLNH